VTECVKDPLVPVIVTPNVPKALGNPTLSVAVAELPGESWTLDGLRDTARPIGDTVLVRETLPLKPLTLVIVIVEVEDEPPHPPKTREVGLAIIV
jgi:hypothetical protein